MDVRTTIAAIEERCTYHKMHRDRMEAFAERTNRTLAQIQLVSWIVAGVLSMAVAGGTWAVRVLVKDVVSNELRVTLKQMERSSDSR